MQEEVLRRWGALPPTPSEEDDGSVGGEVGVGLQGRPGVAAKPGIEGGILHGNGGIEAGVAGGGNISKARLLCCCAHAGPNKSRGFNLERLAPKLEGLRPINKRAWWIKYGWLVDDVRGTIRPAYPVPAHASEIKYGWLVDDVRGTMRPAHPVSTTHASEASCRFAESKDTWWIKHNWLLDDVRGMIKPAYPLSASASGVSCYFAENSRAKKVKYG
eukprot:scaffold172764_cov20-Tisochrysis_lutea.AAC.1